MLSAGHTHKSTEGWRSKPALSQAKRRTPSAWSACSRLPRPQLQAIRMWCATYVFTGVATCERGTLGTIAAATLCAVAFLRVLAGDMHIMVLRFCQRLACCTDPLLFDFLSGLQDRWQQVELRLHGGLNVAVTVTLAHGCRACMQCLAPSGHAYKSCLAADGCQSHKPQLHGNQPAACKLTHAACTAFCICKIHAQRSTVPCAQQVPSAWGCLLWAPWCAAPARAQHSLPLLTTSRCISPLMSMASKLSQEQGMRGKSTSNCSSNRVGSHGEHQLQCQLSAWRCAGYRTAHMRPACLDLFRG
jgi:hypothetical protein